MDLEELTDPGFILYFPIYALAKDKHGVPRRPIFDPKQPAEISPLLFPSKGSIILFFTDEDLAHTAAEDMASEGHGGQYPIRIDHSGHLLPLLEFFQSHGVEYVGIDFDIRRRGKGGYQKIEAIIQGTRIGNE